MDGTFRVLLYNVRGLPSFVTGNDTAHRSHQIAALLNAFDLVGVQEDFDADSHTILMRGTRHAYRNHFDDPLPYRLYGAGLTALSAYPIVQAHHRHYASCFGELLGRGETDCVVSKGFQITRIRLGGSEDTELHFYNTHLDAGDNPEDYQARRAQIDALIDAMAQESTHTAVLLVADTNASWEELEHLLRAGGLRDACREVECAEDGRIERVLLRSSDRLKLEVSAWRNERAFFDASGEPLSDHPAISARIAWRLAPASVEPAAAAPRISERTLP